MDKLQPGCPLNLLRDHYHLLTEGTTLEMINHNKPVTLETMHANSSPVLICTGLPSIRVSMDLPTS